MILFIDNYDSFTYNLVQYVGEIRTDFKVYRNDKIALDEIREMKPEKIIISPGPGTPKDAGISVSVIKEFHKQIPILGVCLGHQSIGEAFGGKIVNAPVLMHGKTSRIHHDGKTLFEGIESPFVATRYHSLIIEKSSLPAELEISGYTEDTIMAVRHKEYPTEGVQFHPESILTREGKKIIKNFLSAD